MKKRVLLPLALTYFIRMEAQVSLVKDFSLQDSPYNSGTPAYTLVHDGKLYLTASDYEGGLFSPKAIGLFELNDLSGNVKKIYSPKRALLYMISSGKNLFFASRELPTTNPYVNKLDVLYCYNGTDIIPVDTLSENISGGNSLNAIAFEDGRIIYQQETTTEGIEWWVTDGTKAGTKILKDITPGTGSTYSLTNAPGKMGLLHKGKIYFGTTTSLWETDGSEAGTVKVSDDPVNAGYAWAKNNAYFAFTKPATGEIAISDGTANGTQTLKGGEIMSVAVQIIDNTHSDNMYLLVKKFLDQERMFLYKTSGKYNDTVLVLQDAPTKVYARAVEFRGNLYTLSQGSSSSEIVLGRIDATTKTASVLKKFTNTGLSYFGPFKVTSSKFYFIGQDNDGLGTQYYESDGTVEGTKRITDKFISAASMQYYEVFKDVLVFPANDGTSTGIELWATLDQLPTNLSDPSVSSKTWAAYPNPTEGTVWISTPSAKGEVQLFDIMGNKVAETHVSNTSTLLDLSSLKPGVYALEYDQAITRVLKK